MSDMAAPATSAFGRALVGRQSLPFATRVETSQLKFFAKATDQRDPVYFDEAAAWAAGHRALPVPPTFAFTLTLASPEQAGYGLVQVGADIRQVLHAEQGFCYHAMLYAGDEITLTTRIVDLYEKKGGALRFVVQQTDVADAAGRLCIECDTTFVLRTPPGQGS